MWLYVCLVVLRVIWSLSPQTGYIHPDEFFQSVEVIAGDTFNITVERTWEFEGSTPIRSIAINKVLFTPIFTLLRYLTSELEVFTLTRHAVLTSSRAVMTCLSFLLDYHIWKLCKVLNPEAYSGLVLLSSSYVMLTYQTHSFSNSIETVFILCLFSRIIDCTSETFSSKKQGKNRPEKNKTIDETNYQEGEGKVATDFKSDYNFRNRKKNTGNGKKYITNKQDMQLKGNCYNETSQKHTYSDKKNNREYFRQHHIEIGVTLKDCVLLALFNTLGIFNRPTFALFSICPFVWWCFCMRKDFVNLIRQVTLFILFTICFFLMICIVDTCYYGDLKFDEIFSVKFFTQKLKITPLNFVKYNTNTANLESHGRHPFYLHFLVNFPLLFGPLAIIVFWGIYLNLKQICISMKTVLFSKTTNYSIICGLKKQYSFQDTKKLSSKPSSSQKQLLLICIIMPIISLSIFPHQEPRFLIPLLPFVILYSIQSVMSFNKPFWFVYLLFNIILCIFYGVLHQGGITRCLFKIQEMSILPEFSHMNTTILFSHTYMPPKHLLLLDKQSNFSIHDLKGSNYGVVQKVILDYKQEQSSNSHLFLVIPGTVLQDFKSKLKLISNATVMDQFRWHLSMEEPPTLPWEDFRTYMNQISLFLLKL